MSRKSLNFREYWDAVGTENIQRIADDLGSSIKYFRMFRYGIKKPGAPMALRIIYAARCHTAPYEPDLELLLAGVPRANGKATPTIPPAAEYLRARRRVAKKAGAAA